jgi:thiamine-phosphate pyrophosphorylase
MALSRLYFVTMDEARVGHVEQVAAACAAGIRWIQLRMKEASDAEVLAAALAAKPICERYGCMLLVNDRVEVAIAAGVQGVHLGQLDMAVGEARRRLGEGKIIGGTANTMAQLREHWRRGADYIGLGPYRYTVVAIGGIGAADVAPLLEAGLYGVAFSGMLVHADDPAALVRSLSNEIKMHEHAENCG